MLKMKWFGFKGNMAIILLCLAGVFASGVVNPAYAVSFAVDKIDVYEDGRHVSEDVVLIEYEGVIEICEAGTCFLGQQYKQNPTLHRLREPLKNFEKRQEEYLAQRPECLKDKEGKKLRIKDECGSGEPAVLMYEKYKKEQAKNALYSKTIILPEIVDRSVYHVDPKMPTGGMIGAFRCFRVDLKDAQVEMDECKKNEMKLESKF